MSVLASGLNTTGDFIGKRVGNATSEGAKGIGNALDGVRGFVSNAGDRPRKRNNSKPQSASGTAQQAASSEQDGKDNGGLSRFSTITSGVTSGATWVLRPTAEALKSGATLSHDATAEGFSIGQKIAKSGLDMSSNVVTGTASFTGTALGGVVATAADTSGALFEPVGSGLKAVEGLNKLGQQGFEAINGLGIGAVNQFSMLTLKAMNMSGMTPTFFDQDADGVVTVPDTVRGLILLGLDEQSAKYAAYALHAIFSYPTSENWLPELNSALPIHIARMGSTRWGKNWGTFERLEWVDDVEIDRFFVDNEDKKPGWSDYLKEKRQGFGVLLLLFEWGTSWPFYIPPNPIPEIPFSNGMGMVVRKAILPTIMLNFKKAKAAEDKPEQPNEKAQIDGPPNPTKV